MAEISLKQQKGKIFKVETGFFREFSAASKLMVIELLCQVYSPDHIPAVITLRFLTSDGWRTQEVTTDTFGLSVIQPNGFFEPAAKKQIFYSDSLAMLYRFLLHLKRDKPARRMMRRW